MWLSNQTRPDIIISNAVTEVVRYMHATKLDHWLMHAARAILGYLRVTRSYGTTFQRGSGLEV